LNSCERFLHERSDALDLLPADPGHRIEVDAKLVGMIEILGAHRMRMQLEAREVREPCERCGVARNDLVGAAPDGKRSSPPRSSRGATRRALLVEELAVDAVGKRTSMFGLPPAPRSAPEATAR
jgi:hypothetical protein